MRGFKLLLFGLCFRLALSFVNAEVAPTDAGSIGGILARTRTSDFLTVEYVAAQGPTDDAGIKKGDLIVAINGVSTRGMSPSQARDAMRGEIGGVVKLTVRRAGSPDQQVLIARRSLLDTYSQAAEEGDPRAEYSLGRFYDHGLSTAPDVAKAAQWYRKSADQGYAPAQTLLGYMYRWGRGIAQDQGAAAAWYLKAATQGDAVAERSLAELYYWGNGVKQSYRDSFAWFYSAATQGDAVAERFLAEQYCWGEGVKQSYQVSFAWFYSAATQGDAVAERFLAELYYWGDGVKQSYRDSFAWYYTAATQGDAVAERCLAGQYHSGKGVKQSYRDSFAWYYSAATQGDAVAERCLAEQYYWGESVKQSDKDAFAWFYSAAQQDDSTAEEHLAFLYRTGSGVNGSDRDAFAWYYQSALQNNAYGEWGLAYMYQHGRGVKSNIGAAIKWYQKAHAALPDNENLTRDLADISLNAFLENPDLASLDSSLIMAAFGPGILLGFIVLAAIYVAGGVVLFIFTSRASDAPPRLFVVIGWILFYLESQGVAMLATFIFGKSLSAEGFFVLIAVFSGLPVIVSSFGPNRNRIWQASLASWKTLLLYGVGSWLAIFIIFLGYDKIYALLTHAPLPSQPTQALIGKAKHASVWLAFATITLVLSVTEEIIFRGYCLDALRKRFSGKIAVPISAFAFSLIHFQALYFVPLFGFGLVLGWVRLKTGSLRLPMVLHVLNNGLFLALSV